MNRYFLRVVLLMAVIGAFVWSGSLLIERIDPVWNATTTLLISVILALEGVAASLFVQRQHLRGGERWQFRLIELACLLGLVHLIDIAISGQFDKMPTIFFLPDGHGLGMLIGTVAIWAILFNTMEDFDALDDATMVGVYLHATRTTPLGRLTTNLFTGGIALFIIAAIGNHNGIPADWLFLALTLYFAAGILLLARSARDAGVLRWTLEGISLTRLALGPWLWFAGVVILMGIGIALLLPTSPFHALTDGLSAILTWLGNILSPSTLPNSPYQPTLIPTLPLNGIQPLPQMLPTYGSSTPPPSLNFFGPLAQWTVLLIAIAYIVRTYWRDYPGIAAGLRQIKLVDMLWAFLRTLIADLRAARRSIRRYTPRLSELFRARAARQIENRLVQSSRRSPREEIYYYYLAVLRHAAEGGIPRTPSHTPYEYQQILNVILEPQVESFDALTQAFIAARYSRTPIDAARVRLARGHYEQVRKTLQAIQRDKH